MNIGVIGAGYVGLVTGACSADLSYVDSVAKAIAENLHSYKVIVTKSTVPVGTGERIKDIIKNINSECEFDIVSNPEFLREGSAVEDFMRPDRIVIGSGSERASSIVRDLYRPLYIIETPFIMTDIETAEMIKYASNVFLAAKISFINEMANLCEKVGANVQVVAKAMGLDKRIGVLGLAFKPNTNDIRESPAIHIIEGLIDIGANIRVYDPAAMDDAKAVLGNKVTYCNDAFDVATNTDALILVTEWNQFRNLQLEKMKGLLEHPVFEE